MNKKIVSGIMFTLLLLGISMLAFNVQPVGSKPATIVVPDDYSTIQEAINNANDGDTIFVRAGTYETDYVTVDKTVRLVGESRDTTAIKVIDGEYGSPVVVVVADNVEITGFTIEDGACGIIQEGANCYIHGNIIAYNICCNLLVVSNGSMITGNIVSFVVGDVFSILYGIRLEGSDNMISGNNITENGHYGIWLDSSSNNTISGNNIKYNGCGICLDHSSNNLIYHNNFVDNSFQVGSDNSVNVWDYGYPSGGNYWSDYGERYPNATERDASDVWDTPYVIDENNQDNYPLMNPWPIHPPLPLLRVEPESYNASRIDEIFSVNITINDLDVDWCMSSVGFTLKYNSTILEVLEVVDGPFMREVADAYQPVSWGEGNWTTYYFYVYFIPSEPDYIMVVLQIHHPPIWMRIYPEGSGTLATITFKATTGPQAQCVLQLKDTLLCDEWMNEIAHNTEYGYYRILVGDLNVDGKVNIKDIATLGLAFGSYPGHPRWNPNADMDNNGVVNIMDVVKIAKNFGKYINVID